MNSYIIQVERASCLPGAIPTIRVRCPSPPQEPSRHPRCLCRAPWCFHGRSTQPWEPTNKKTGVEGPGIRHLYLPARCHLRISQGGWQSGVSSYTTPTAEEGSQWKLSWFEDLLCLRTIQIRQIRNLLCNQRCCSISAGCVAGQERM